MLAHERHAQLRTRSAAVTRAVAVRIHLSNVAGVFDLWMAVLLQSKAQRDVIQRGVEQWVTVTRSAAVLHVWWVLCRHALQIATLEGKVEDEEEGKLAWRQASSHGVAS